MASEIDDTGLMLRYQAGDAGAFEALYGRYKGSLYRYLLRQCRDAEAASDLFQEVWGRVVRARDRYRPTAQFNTYLFRIAHNCCVDHYRREQRRPGGPVDIDASECMADPEAGPEAMARNYERAGRLLAALGELPAEQREAFLLREETGMSLEEIGEATGVGRETAKSRLRYAVQRLRRALTEPNQPGIHREASL
ncbi:MAG: RNA polymerase sigma factor [Gammaproteobacteria bacterium]